MLLQKVFKAGNSNVVALPKSFIKQGDAVYVEELADSDAVIIRKAQKKKSKQFSEKDFDNWLKVFLKENGEMIDELALR